MDEIYQPTLKEIIDHKFEYKSYITGTIDYPQIREPIRPKDIENSNINLTDDYTKYVNNYLNIVSTKLAPVSKLNKKFSRKKILLKSLQSLIRNYKINPIKKGYNLLLDFLNLNKIYRSKYIDIELIKELKDSKELLNLGEDWDGEGSIGYQKKTWKKMVNFLQEMSLKFYIDTRNYLITPFINPGSKGDIDLHWKTKEFELFLSIPQSENDPMTYYGDDYKKNEIEGSFEENNFEEILSWLKKFLP